MCHQSVRRSSRTVVVEGSLERAGLLAPFQHLVARAAGCGRSLSA
jgi:hypothetical protein